MVAKAKDRTTDIVDQAEQHFADPSKAGQLFIPSAPDALSIGNTIGFDYDAISEAFPDVDSGEIPLGNLVLMQIRQPKTRSSGQVILPTDLRQTEFYNTQVARVISYGALAFHNRNTGELWPEGMWVKAGDFVRIPKYQGERFSVPYTRADHEIRDGVRVDTIVKDEAHFVMLKDLGILSITKNPLTSRAFY